MVLIRIVALSRESSEVRHALAVIVRSCNLRYIRIERYDSALIIIAGTYCLGVEAVNSHALIIASRAKASGIGKSEADFRNLIAFHWTTVLIGLYNGAQNISMSII